MTNKHRHSDMIIAKANNMELVSFCKPKSETKWQEMSRLNFPDFGGSHDYFLCLPIHAKHCLHWLNGGDTQQSPIDINQWVLSGSNKSWFCKHSFMNDNLMFRIKPRKEKRWIVYRGGRVYGEYLSLDDINEDFKLTGQFIEIEVEV